MNRLLPTTAVLIVALAAAVGAADIATMLPNGRALDVAPGAVTKVGTLPVAIALARDGTRALVVENGLDPSKIRIVDTQTLAVQTSLDVKGAYGTPLIDERGDGAWIAGGNADRLYHLDLTRAAIDREIVVDAGCWPSALVRTNDRLIVACESKAQLLVLDAAMTIVAHIDVGKHPSSLVATGNRVYASAWGERSIDVIDVGTARVERRIAVGDHPEAQLLAPDGKHLYVANTDDDTISTIDLSATNTPGAVTPVFLDATGLVGNSISALTLSPDGQRLYATASAANAVYALRITDGYKLERIGAIATGWYPTATLVLRDGALVVVNGKGESSRPNPQFSPLTRGATRSGYIAHELVGSLRRYVMPSDELLASGDRRVRELAGPVYARAHPILRANGPIKHVIYIVKENRTFDQVLGDVPLANGDPSLVLFGREITPNQHALVARFGVFDNTYTNAHVSADGHNWSTAAFANDYVEKMWPPQYGGRRKTYDFEDATAASRPHDGYLWDAAERAHVSVRNYGEYVYDTPENGTNRVGPPNLLAQTDPKYPGYDTNISDLVRVAEWEREFRQFERSGALPQLEIVRLGNDHTDGTRAGSLTPQALVAQNDAAIGRLVDVVSHSRFWKNTAIFSIEDDCQNGPDHVDDQRTTFYLSSPYAMGGVQRGHYTTAGVLRTIEILLGLLPLSTYDARALPLYDAFATSPANLVPFTAVAPLINIEARNAQTAYRTNDSAKIDSREADTADSGTFNDILWHAVKGAQATTPPFGTFRR